MTPSELQSSIVAAWKAQKPADNEAALAIANTVLADYPKERTEFAKWFERNGASVLQGLKIV